MVFASPLWLIALAPWAAVAVWVLVGRRRRQWVPFLALWEAPEELRKPQKGMEWPPLAIVLALLAALFAVLCAAQPLLATKGARKLTVIVDRGAAMSTRAGGEARFLATCREARRNLADLNQPIEIRMLTVPAGGEWTGPLDKWLDAVGQLRRTAVRTDPAAALASIPRDEPVLVVTDQFLPQTSNTAVLAPAGGAAVRNVGITALAARQGQVMVRLRSTSAISTTLMISSGGNSIQRAVAFASPGSQDLFLELSAPNQIIQASLNSADDFDADDRAWLVRRGSWPNIETRIAVSEELERFIAVYSRHRPAGDASTRVAIGRGGDLQADEPGIVVEALVGEPQSGLNVTVEDHPVTAAVDFSPLRTSVIVAPKPPGEGWRTILRLEGKPALAVSEGETRRAWIGFDSAQLARTPSFVVLWTNLVDWVGGTSTGYLSSPLDDSASTSPRRLPESLPGDVDPRYWPGVFQAPTGLLAANAHELALHPGAGASLDPLRLNVRHGYSLVPWLMLAAIAALVGAAATWERRRLPRPLFSSHLAVQDEIAVQTSVEADGHLHRHSAPKPTP